MDKQRDSVARPYGDDLAGRFHLEAPKSHVTRALKRGLLAVTQIKSDRPTPEPSQSIGYDEAYLIGLMIDDVPDHELWQDGKAVKTPAFRHGDTALYDLRRDPVSFTRCAHHSLHFYLPRAALREIAAQSGVTSNGELHYRFAQAHDDPVVRRLGAAVLPALERGDVLDGLFLDHVLQAMAAHVLQRYGDIQGSRPRLSGGLAQPQLQRAQEMMRAGLGSDISLATLAQACNLSPAHFARAFQRSTGRSPHAWLQEQRLDRAKTMLKGEHALSDIALDCGFADQSHFTRVFSKSVGTSPGRWRRALR